MKIALAGNPNSGKTTLFNAITGKAEYVGNWPGVTVEKKAAALKRGLWLQSIAGIGHSGAGFDKDSDHLVVDLPGAYSIAPYSSEEAIARDFITGENLDVIINIIDAGNLERSLFFTTQLLELGLPMVIALNKQDVIRQRGDHIDAKGLASTLGCDIVEVTANAGAGLKELIAAAYTAAEAGRGPDFQPIGKNGGDVDVERQKYIKRLVGRYLKRKRMPGDITVSDRIDRIVAHPVIGLPIFAAIMWAVYAFSIGGLGGWLSAYLGEDLFGQRIPDAMNAFFESYGVHPLLQGLIVDGAVGGAGAVISFIPLIMVLFFCLALLEDSGYMARVAVIMDRYFKKIGLSGKSVIPMIVGSGCSIPGVMASRTIEDDNERKVTVMLAPFVPCGAKMPVIALFSAVFFPGAAWVFPATYLMAGLLIIGGGLILKRIFGFEGDSTFIIELPEYRLPSLKHAARQVLRQAKAFLVKATTIILVMNTLVWFLQTYSWDLSVAGGQEDSMLALLGGLAAPLLIPLGFAGWQAAAAALTGLVAKENVVATLAILLAASDEALRLSGGPLSGLFTPVTALAFLAFNLFIPPCFAAIGAMNAELGTRKWLGRAILFQLATGYTVAMLISQIGTLLVYGSPADGYQAAIAIFLAIAAGILILIGRNRNRVRVCDECSVGTK